MKLPIVLPLFDISDQTYQMMRSQRILKDHQTPSELLQVVSQKIFSVEKNSYHTPPTTITKYIHTFTSLMAEKYVMLGTPTLTNSAYQNMPLSSCIVSPVNLDNTKLAEQSLQTLYKQNMGIGFSLNTFADPITLLQWINQISSQETATKSYDRYIGNMVSLRISHPKIKQFISAKKQYGPMPHVNISIEIPDSFMQAVKDKKAFALDSGEKVDANKLFIQLTNSAWETGDPGIVFMQRLAADNPATAVYPYVTTPPCGEMGLAKGETCQFASINLAKFTEHGDIDYQKLQSAVTLTTRALDNAITYSLPFQHAKISSEVNHFNRKIAIGVCGLADMLVRLNIPYISSEGRSIAREVISYINYTAKLASISLAEERGSCEAIREVTIKNNYKKMILQKYAKHPTKTVSERQWIELANDIYSRGLLRNIATTALPPTGRVSKLLDVTASIEPLFSLYDDNGNLKNVVTEYIHRKYRHHPKEAVRILNLAKKHNSFQKITSLSKKAKQVLQKATEISYLDHIKMLKSLAGVHGVVDESASKTINLAQSSTKQDVANIFYISWKKGVKNISVYRDKSLPKQPTKL